MRLIGCGGRGRVAPDRGRRQHTRTSWTTEADATLASPLSGTVGVVSAIRMPSVVMRRLSVVVLFQLVLSFRSSPFPRRIQRSLAGWTSLEPLCAHNTLEVGCC